LENLRSRQTQMEKDLAGILSDVVTTLDAQKR
jgi:hypothetical protein